MDMNSKERLTRFAAVLIMALSLFVLVLTVNAVKSFHYIGSDAAMAQSSIVVSGTADVFAVPDIAVFSFSVVETGKTVKEAQDKATTKMNASIKTLKDSGIEDKDIKTIGYNAYPKYEDTSVRSSICMENGYCPPPSIRQTIVGYEVSQMIEVKVRDTAKAGDLLTKVGATGVSNVSGIDFRIDDEEKLLAEAREKAIADARAKAEKLAKDLDVTLDGIMSFSDNNMPMYYKAVMGMGGVAMDSAAANAPAPLPQGENKITSTVTITYHIR